MVVSKERNNPLVKIFLAMFSEISLSVFFCFFFFFVAFHPYEWLSWIQWISRFSMTHLNPFCASDFHGMGANMNDRLPHKKTFLQKKYVYLQTKKQTK